MKFDFDIAVIIAFLLLNLIFGLASGRGIKNIREYAIGNRNFSTATIVATIVATWIFGSVVSLNLIETYNNGLYFIIPGIADGISFFIIAYFYAPRMREFLGKLSVAEAMGSIYGTNVRIITAVSGIIPAIGNIAIQFSIFTILLNYLFGELNIYVLVFSSLIVITYSTLGGIKSVTFTDMIQFFTFGVVIPMMVFLIWQEINSVDEISNILTTNPLFDYKEVLNIENPRFSGVIFLFLFFMVPGLDPALFQRITMAKSTMQIAKAFIISGIVITCFYMLVDFAGVLLLADNVTNIDENNVLQYVLDNYCPTGFKGFFMIGIMAMIMSTADSYINTSSILFSYDLCQSLGVKLSEQKTLLLIRISSLLIGIAGLLLSFFSGNLLEMILTSHGFYMPIVSVPLILAIFGFRSSTTAVLIGMVAGFVTVIYFKIFSKVDSIMPGMLGNLVFFMGSHYILGEKGGWVGIKDKSPLLALRLERKRKINNFFQSIKTFSFIKFCQNNTPKEERIFVYFGLFSTIIIFSNAYSVPKNLYEQYMSTLNFIYYSKLVLSAVFITYPVWIEKFKNKIFISVLWNLTVFYNLVFCSSLLVVISLFNQINVAVLITGLITVAILMRWQVAISMIISGVAMSIWLYENYIELDFVPDYVVNLQFKIIYFLLLISTVLIAFLKPKQEQNQLTEDKVLHLDSQLQDHAINLEKALKVKNEFLQNIEHEGHTPITGITSTGQVLYEYYDRLSDKERKDLARNIARSSDRLLTLVNNLIDVSKLSTMKYQLNKTRVNLTDLLYSRLEYCKKLYLEQENLNFLNRIEDNVLIEGDRHYITSAIDSLIINSIKHARDGDITISLHRSESELKFSISNKGKIPPEELNAIFEPFIIGSNSRTKSGAIPNGQRGLGLTLCKLAIEAHGGRIWAENSLHGEVIFKFTIPVSKIS
jgi:Na+/proline symporter/signal transduction histidine kinase